MAAVRRRSRTLTAAVAASIVLVSVHAVVPLATQRAVDDVIVRGRADALNGYLVALLSLAVVRAAAGGARKYYAIKLQGQVGADVRTVLFDHLQRLSFTSHARLGSGDLMARVAGDVNILEVVSGTFAFLAQAVVLGLVSVVLCFVVDPVIAAVTVTVAMGAGLLTLRQTRTLYGRSRAFHDAGGEYSQFAEQQVRGIRIIKGHGLEAVEQARGAAAAKEVARRGQALAKARGRFLGWFAIVPTSSVVATIAVAGWRASGGHLTPGEALAFLQLLGGLAAPFAVVAQVIVQLQYADAAGARIVEVLDIPPDPPVPAAPVRLPDGPGQVEFDDVWFGYEGAEPVLRGLSLVIRGGESVAIVGASGAGKTTAAHLVARFFDPSSGEVRIDGVATAELAPVDLRGAVGVVFEDTVLFSDSIWENIRMGRPTAGDHEVREAAALAQVDEFALALPEGYDTLVGEQGIRLSGGQRQRIAIARAILRNPRILILDDATSAVDPATEDLVRRGLRAVTDHRTTIIVAHRVETIALADRVILLQDGGVKASGTHDELLRDPAYCRALALEPVQ